MLSREGCKVVVERKEKDEVLLYLQERKKLCHHKREGERGRGWLHSE